MDGLWGKAMEAAEDARLLLAAGRFDAAANRAYFAMFNAERALLAKSGDDPGAMKKHATVQRRFSMKLVKDGPFGEEAGRALRQAGDARVIADYDDCRSLPVARRR